MGRKAIDRTWLADNQNMGMSAKAQNAGRKSTEVT